MPDVKLSQLPVQSPLTVEAGKTLWTPQDSGWQALTLKNSWAGADPYAPPACRKLGSFVTLRGSLFGGAYDFGTVLCTLPSGFRPPDDLQVAVATTSSSPKSRLLVRASGDVQIYDVDSASVALDGTSFFID